MSCKNDALKANLMSKAEALIDEFLANRKAPDEVTLADIEQAVLVVGQEFERTLTTELVQESAAKLEREWPVCTECGERMKAKEAPGERDRRSERGTRVLPLCRMRRGFFPLWIDVGDWTEARTPSPTSGCITMQSAPDCARRDATRSRGWAVLSAPGKWSG